MESKQVKAPCGRKRTLLRRKKSRGIVWPGGKDPSLSTQPEAKGHTFKANLDYTAISKTHFLSVQHPELGELSSQSGLSLPLTGRAPA